MARNSASDDLIKRGMFGDMPRRGWVSLALAVGLFVTQLFIMQRFNTEGDAWYGWMPAYYMGAAALLGSFAAVIAFGVISWRTTEKRRHQVDAALARDFYSKHN